MSTTKQAWLHSPWVDGIFILSPPFLCLAAVALFPSYFQETDVSLAAWVALVLLIDVGHVYSTLFRTYFEKESVIRLGQLLWVVPLSAWVMGMLLHTLDSGLFWRILAYLAVYHFIRQQYGFMQLYARKEVRRKWERMLDALTIYTATLYPLLFWHLEGHRDFLWFIQGDFLLTPYPSLLPILNTLYFIILAVYLLKELLFSIRNKTFNVARNLLVVGTILSWYLGIVYYNGDLIFTLFNVVSHGIPYLALVWIYGRRKRGQAIAVPKEKGFRFEGMIFSSAGIILFLLLVFGLAYLEEGLWDGFVWRERASFFSFFEALPAITDQAYLSIIVPLLAVPQITHYVLDGFIWRVRKDKQLRA